MRTTNMTSQVATPVRSDMIGLLLLCNLYYCCHLNIAYVAVNEHLRKYSDFTVIRLSRNWNEQESEWTQNQAKHNARFIVFGEDSRLLTSHDNEVRMVEVLSLAGNKSIVPVRLLSRAEAAD
jgi:hypothetical protein